MGVALQTLRHSYAPPRLDAGVHPRLIPRSLGHTQLETTLISRPLPHKGQEEADERLNPLMQGLLPCPPCVTSAPPSRQQTLSAPPPAPRPPPGPQCQPTLPTRILWPPPVSVPALWGTTPRAPCLWQLPLSPGSATYNPAGALPPPGNTAARAALPAPLSRPRDAPPLPPLTATPRVPGDVAGVGHGAQAAGP
jgi:hypothetical protein